MFIELIRDNNNNGSLDESDSVIESKNFTINIPSNGNRLISEQFTVNNMIACPVFIRINQNSSCACDTYTKY